MKTTLKRGIGRVAETNGNGRAVFPPGVLTPVTRYRQPEPPRRTRLQWAGHVLLWLLVALLTVGGGLVAGSYLYLQSSVHDTKAKSAAVKRAEQDLDEVPPASHPTTALVLGYDRRRYGPERNLPARSDTILLVRADPQTQSISLLSFPRDLLVPIRCPGKSFGTDRINAAYEDCGPRGTLLTVKALTGVDVNYLITVNFRGFRRVVDTLGGVWIDVDRRYYNENRGTPGTDYANIDLQPGYQRLTGKQALDFARFRHTDSDLYRIARQQFVVKALKEQFTRHFGVTSIPNVVNAITRNVEIGRHGDKPLELTTVLSYAEFAHGLPSGHFFDAKIGDLTGYNELSAPQSAIQEAVQEFEHPDVEAAQKATAVALNERLRTRGIPPKRISVLVLNGTTQTGLANATSYELGRRGYRTLQPPNGLPANAPTSNYYDSKAYYDPRQPLSQKAAHQLAAMLGSATVEPIPLELRSIANGAMVVVVLGQTYPGNLPAAAVDRTPKHHTPNVTSNAALARPYLTRARRRVPFRLELPTTIERTSTLDYEEPMRVYAVSRGHRAVRLVFRTGAMEFWGIEETDWNGAPVLSGRNVERHLGRRVFDLYYTGPHLHMVVLRQNGATYWVVNTLLDSLSNETMLAIAKGFRPLPK